MLTIAFQHFNIGTNGKEKKKKRSVSQKPSLNAVLEDINNKFNICNM